MQPTQIREESARADKAEAEVSAISVELRRAVRAEELAVSRANALASAEAERQEREIVIKTV